MEKHGKSLDYEHFRRLIIKNNIDVDPELLEMLHHVTGKTREYPDDRDIGLREKRKIKVFAAIIKTAYRVSKGRGTSIFIIVRSFVHRFCCCGFIILVS